MSWPLRYWIIILLVITTAYGTMYATLQQSYRQSANDPQIQLAEDNAARLSIDPVLPPPTRNLTDMAKSLGVFVIFYNDKYQPVFSTAKLDGKVPVPPKGVFEYAKKNSENRLTWEPKSGVREAAIIAYYQGKATSGYVLSGRSLREVEIRESSLFRDIAAAWLITVVVSLAACYTFLKDRNSLAKTNSRKK